VLLTGPYAYKIKKPVDFGFLDFSTLERRKRFCDAELALNRRFAKSLYIDVVSIVATANGARVAEDGEPIEYAVRMRQFPAEMQLDRLLAAGVADAAALAEFGAALADTHATLPAVDASTEFGTAAGVWKPVDENFVQIRQSPFAAVDRATIDALERASRAEHARVAATFDRRRRDGFVRECHGDLHLSNMVRLDGVIQAFDCIEFSDALRWIDVISDAAFLVMDSCVRERVDLGYAFLDRYLERSGDYAGAATLRFYLVYRSMVRAKVAALRAHGRDDADARRTFDAHVAFARLRSFERPAALVLMCGVSGSGKSWLAERLVPRLGAARVRSDVERKRLAALDPLASSGSKLDEGLYGARATDDLYRHLERCAEAMLDGGERVIVDATFASALRRAQFRRAAARRGARCVVVHCVAPKAVLVDRIEQRERAGGDPSEATVAVLERQLERLEPPADDEPAVVTIDTRESVDVDAIARRLESLLASN
jgi:aminoglycoside phosphotransferase family enzyme/predicted kinase